MNLLTVTLSDLVDATLYRVQADVELGRRIILSDNLTTGTTTFNVSDATLFGVTDVLEFGAELMFVTAKSSDLAGADVTVVRGYYGSTATTHSTNDVGAINPPYPRIRVAKLLQTAFTYMESNGLPLIKTTAELTPIDDPNDDYFRLLEVPTEARRVVDVLYGVEPVPNWRFVQHQPAAEYSQPVVVLPRITALLPDDTYSVVYQAPYRWSNHPTFPVEADTISIPEGAQDVPPEYAAWKLAEAREMSRHQTDRSSEMTERLPETGTTLVRLKRDSFFSAMDAARRVEPRRVTRSFVSRPTYDGLHLRGYPRTRLFRN